MGKISSSVEAVKSVQFFMFPRTPIQARITRSRDTVVAVGKSGRVYTNVNALSRWTYCDGSEDWAPEIYECMLALGLVTPADIERHTRYVKAEAHCQKLISWLADTKRWADHPVLRTPLKKRLKVWDSLDPWGQDRAARYGYMPEGATKKPIPVTQQSGAKFKTVSAARAATIAESRLQKKIAVLGDTDPKRWPALRVSLKKRLKVWDSLDPLEQEKVARDGYMPEGATKKPLPESPA